MNVKQNRNEYWENRIEMLCFKIKYFPTFQMYRTKSTETIFLRELRQSSHEKNWQGQIFKANVS